MDLKKEIRFKDLKALKAGKAAQYPTKRSVNLAKRDTNNQDLKTLVIGVIIIAILCLLVVKFGISDQYARLSAAESEYAQVHTQYVDMQNSLKNYAQVEQEYHTYSRDWMTNSESTDVTVDRTEVLNLIEQSLMSYGDINSFKVNANVVSVSMSGMNLSEISTMFSNLQAQPLVESANLNIASTQKSSTEALEFSITITLASQDDEEASGSSGTAAASGTSGGSGTSGSGKASSSGSTKSSGSAASATSSTSSSTKSKG